MSTIKVDMQNAADEIAKELKKFKSVSDRAVITAIDSTAKTTVKNIRAKAPGRGPYKRSWSHKVTTPASNGNYGRTVYSKKPGLPHLLEHGHEIKGYLAGRGRSRTNSYPHIQDDETTEKLFEEKLKEEIEKG